MTGKCLTGLGLHLHLKSDQIEMNPILKVCKHGTLPFNSCLHVPFVCSHVKTLIALVLSESG